MRTGLVLILVCTCGLVVPASAEPPLADQLPAETLLYAGWAGTGLTFDGSLTEAVAAHMVDAAAELDEAELKRLAALIRKASKKKGGK